VASDGENFLVGHTVPDEPEPAFVPVEASVTADVESYAELIEALDDDTIDRINVIESFTLEDHVTIDREVVIASDDSCVITMDELVDELPEAHSFIVADGGDLTVGGNLTLAGVGPGAFTSPIGIVQVDTGGSFTLAGGAIEAEGYSDGEVELPGLGICVNGGDAIISSGVIYASCGVLVNSGALTFSGTAELEADDIGVYVFGGAAAISGGQIDADYGVAVAGGTVTIGGTAGIFAGETGVRAEDGSTVVISGEAYIAGDDTGVYVEGGTATIGGEAAVEGDNGVHVEGGTAVIGGEAAVAGNTGVYVEGGTATIGDYASVEGNTGVHVEGGAATIGGTAEINADSIGVDVEDQYDDEDILLKMEQQISAVMRKLTPATWAFVSPTGAKSPSAAARLKATAMAFMFLRTARPKSAAMRILKASATASMFQRTAKPSSAAAGYAVIPALALKAAPSPSAAAR
jgi:hypothetical protein